MQLSIDMQKLIAFINKIKGTEINNNIEVKLSSYNACRGMYEHYRTFSVPATQVNEIVGFKNDVKCYKFECDNGKTFYSNHFHLLKPTL